MKSFTKLINVVVGIFGLFSFAQDSMSERVFYTEEQMLKMCGAPIDPVKMKNLDAVQDSMYKSYLSTLGSLQESGGISWREYMSDVENQEEYPCCGIFAATAVAEGQLQILFGSRIGEHGINLDELEKYDPEIPALTEVALGSIQYSKIGSEIGSYPNYEGVKWTILTHTNRSTDPNLPLWGIDRIKEALEYGPITAEFKIYQDFPYYYWSHVDTAVYHWNGTSPYTGSNHAIAIVGYYEDIENPENSYWLCKNSWTEDWGDDGYFRMGFGECGIEIINCWRVTVDNTCYAKIVSNLQTFQVAMNSWWTNNEKAHILNNIIITSGQTNSVPSGAYILFSNNTSLTINGTLSAVGTTGSKITFDFTSPSSTYQNGIKFNSGSGGMLSYCNIKNAYHGVKCYSNLPTIQYCDIYNNGTGIYIYNAGSCSSQICNNNIHNNSTNGIFIYNSTVINVHNNIITNNGECGLYCTSNGKPYLWENIISNNGQAGVYCIINSPALFGDRRRHPGYNLITQNYTGVTCGLESDVRIGAPDLAGYNSIHDNTGYEVSVTYDSYVMAEYNWWNRYPPTYPNYYYAGDFYTFMGGTIDYIPALTYDPLVGGLAKTVAYDLNEPGSNPPIGSASSIFLDSELIEALGYLFDEKYEYAIAIYVKRLNNETDKSKQKYILSCIAECYELSGKNGFIEYLNNDVRQNLSRKDELYAKTLELENYVLMQAGKIQEAIDNYLIMKNEFADNEAIQKNALFNLGYLHYVALDNRDQGQAYFEEFIKKYPDEDLNLIIYETMGEPEKWKLIKKIAPPIADEADIAVLPSEYRLLNNYPNPFNPSTTIAYDLPQESHVMLTIYDILGREVIRLIDESQPAGIQKVIWYGRDSYGQLVPSGIYLYSLKTTSGFNATEKMIFMR